MDNKLPMKTAKIMSLENLYAYGIIKLCTLSNELGSLLLMGYNIQ